MGCTLSKDDKKKDTAQKKNGTGTKKGKDVLGMSNSKFGVSGRKMKDSLNVSGFKDSLNKSANTALSASAISNSGKKGGKKDPNLGKSLLNGSTSKLPTEPDAFGSPAASPLAPPQPQSKDEEKTVSFANDTAAPDLRHNQQKSVASVDSYGGIASGLNPLDLTHEDSTASSHVSVLTMPGDAHEHKPEPLGCTFAVAGATAAVGALSPKGSLASLVPFYDPKQQQQQQHGGMEFFDGTDGPLPEDTHAPSAPLVAVSSLLDDEECRSGSVLSIMPDPQRQSSMAAPRFGGSAPTPKGASAAPQAFSSLASLKPVYGGRPPSGIRPTFATTDGGGAEGGGLSSNRSVDSFLRVSSFGEADSRAGSVLSLGGGQGPSMAGAMFRGKEAGPQLASLQSTASLVPFYGR